MMAEGENGRINVYTLYTEPNQVNSYPTTVVLLEKFDIGSVIDVTPSREDLTSKYYVLTNKGKP